MSQIATDVNPLCEDEMAIGIGRRQFISALGGVAALPLVGRAQQPVFARAGSFVGIASSGTAGSIYPFPNALNTGVPGGTASLPVYTGPTTITTAGTVISGYQIDSPLTINADNVTVENCYFNNVGGNFAVALGGNGDVLKNSEINGGTAEVSQDAVWVGGNNNSVIGNNIHGYSKDIYISGNNVNVTGNYLWGIVSDGEHAENIFIDGATNGSQLGITQTNINISGNTIVCPVSGPVSGPIFISSNFGDVSGVTINTNIIVGGGYTLDFSTNANVANIVTTNNRLGVGKYGYQYGTQTTNGSTFTGNVDFITGQVISSGGNTSPNPNIIVASFADGADPSACFHIPNSGSGSGDSATFAQNLANRDAITLKGCTAGANVVQIYDGMTLLGTTRAAATGIWTYKLTGASGAHQITAKDTKTGITSPVFPLTLP